VRVGALCIADSFPHRFDSDSLTILEYLGRRAVSGLFDEKVIPVRALPQQAPLLRRRTFETLLAAELRIARHIEHTVELLIGELAPGVSPGVFAEQVWGAGARPRLAIGSMGAGLVGLFVRGPAKDAREHVSACLERVRAEGLLAAAGVAAVMASAGLSRSAVVEIAESALSAAEAAGGEPKVERIVVRTEPGEQVA